MYGLYGGNPDGGAENDSSPSRQATSDVSHFRNCFMDIEQFGAASKGNLTRFRALSILVHSWRLSKEFESGYAPLPDI